MRGAFLILVALSLSLSLSLWGCQPLYGGKPEQLKNPAKKKRPPESEALAEVKYIEDCTVDFRADPVKARPQPAVATQLLAEGETAMKGFETSKDPNAQAENIKIAIDKLRNALIKDPYSADATLQLALAYDRVYRKGCALALLKRLATLSQNPKFAKPANLAADRVTDSTGWFKGYRKDAISAVGR